jgi:ABC-type nitrate/sulfonate/bicarbonate transport system substrate-binding protein
VSAIQLRRLLRRTRRRLGLVMALLAITSLVAMHHGAPMDMHAMPAAAVCLGVLGVGVVGAVAAAFGFRARLALPVDWLMPASWPTGPRSVPARAGPLYLRLAVLRR